MTPLVIVFVAVVAATMSVGVVAHRRAWSAWGGPSAWGGAIARRFGAIPAMLIVAIVGYAVTFVVSLALGFLAKAVQDAVDEPTFKWVQARVQDNAFTRLNEKLTYMGNNPIVQLVCLVAVIVLACAYNRRWWLPLLGVCGAYFGERYTQKALARIVDRGHPPTSQGTFPSGGVARVLAVYGTVVVLVLILDPQLSRAWRAGLWTGVATASFVEAFTRVYLSKHWLTDAVFAVPIGALLMLTNVAAVSALAAEGPTARSGAGKDARHLAVSKD
jgi:hypothetical protein